MAFARLSLATVALTALVCLSAPRPAAAAYPSFMAALQALPKTETAKDIIGTLKLEGTLSNPLLALTVLMPEDQYFEELAAKLDLNPGAMTRNAALMRQTLFYHFVTGTGGVKQVFTLGQLKPGMRLDTMYVSTGAVRKPYQLRVAAGPEGRPAIQSVGTTAQVVKGNLRCGAGYIHVIDTVLSPMSLDEVKATNGK